MDKKLQDFFTDAHIPRDARDKVPVFVSQRGIAWVGGLRIAEWAKPRPGAPTGSRPRRKASSMRATSTFQSPASNRSTSRRQMVA